MGLKIVEFAAIVSVALVLGVLWGTWLSLSRSIEEFSADTFLQIGRQMIKNLAVPMRFLMPFMFLTNILLCYLLFARGSQTAGLLTTLGTLTLAGVVIVTLTINVPIDMKIKKWKVGALPADWQEIRRQWQRFHTLRTFLALAGMVFVVAGILLV